jgi:hypothetical protein
MKTVAKEQDARKIARSLIIPSAGALGRWLVRVLARLDGDDESAETAERRRQLLALMDSGSVRVTLRVLVTPMHGGESVSASVHSVVDTKVVDD